MRHRSSRAVPAALVMVAALVSGCGDSSDRSAWESRYAVATVDRPVESPGFAWLHPGRERAPDAPLHTGLEPVVEICGEDGACSVLPTMEWEGAYEASWDRPTGEAGRRFEIRALLSGVPLGSVSVVLGEPRVPGLPIPVRFWIGRTARVADCVSDARCGVGASTAPGGPGAEGAPSVIETRDEEGRLMAVLTVPAEAWPEPLDVLLDCRADDHRPGMGPLFTGLAQWPLYCRIDALRPDGSVFDGALRSAATLELCLVDEALQPDYRRFGDARELRIGATTGRGEFAYLPPTPSTHLPGCGEITIAPEEGLGLLERARAPIDGLLHWVGPKPLNAATVGGGIGGTLTTFGDVNPVAPARIEGRFPGPSGTTIRLTGGGLDRSTTTGADGSYAFDPLPVPPDGVTYTLVAGDERRTVHLPGSGTVRVDLLSSRPPSSSDRPEHPPASEVGEAPRHLPPPRR